MKALTNENAPGQGGVKAVLQKTLQPNFTNKSTASEAQRQRILEALRTGPKTSYELRRLGVYQQSTRIFELRRRGYDIQTERVTLYDRDGFMHRGCARYHLRSAPNHGGRE